MSALQAERENLAKADRDIADGERRISAQSRLTGQLRAAGQDTVDAERLLLILRETLDAWRGHRALIVGEIARLERARPL